MKRALRYGVSIFFILCAYTKVLGQPTRYAIFYVNAGPSDEFADDETSKSDATLVANELVKENPGIEVSVIVKDTFADAMSAASLHKDDGEGTGLLCHAAADQDGHVVGDNLQDTKGA